MRIAFVSQEYPPETAHGGIATQTHAKAHGLAALGHEVHVISASIDGRRHEFRDGEVHVVRIPGFDAAMAVNTEPVRWLTYSALVAAELAALQNRVALDLADFPEFGGEAYIHLLNRTAWNRLPTVIHLQGPLAMLAHTIGWPETDSESYRVGTHIEGSCLRLADAILSSSRCSADWCQKHYGVGGNASVIHAGVDTQLFRPGAVSRRDPLTALFVGRLAASKGVNVLVEAVGMLMANCPELRLRLVGRGDPKYVEEMKTRAAGSGFAHAIEHTGFVPHDKLAEEFAHADVFVAPSRYEGGPGFVYLEAMSCGVPVIACAGSGVAEIVQDGRNGLLVPPDDAAALAASLRMLLSDADRRRSMGRQAREYVLAEADSKVCARRFEGFYRSIVEAAR